MRITGIDTSTFSPQAFQYINKLENEIEILKEQVNLLLQKRYGHSSEQYDSNHNHYSQAKKNRKTPLM